MKELSIQEKARAYDEALEKAKHYQKVNGSAVITAILPELTEISEDEKIRKAIIHFISHTPTVPKGTIGKKTMLTWLEKQGEQKPSDKVEPNFNFNVGQWIVATGKCVYLITKIDGFNVTLVDTNGDEYVFDVSSLDDAHQWNIADAKEGDVLTCYSDIKGQPIEQTGIIKKYVGRHGGCSNSFKVHFGIDWYNNVVIEGYMGSSNIYPSTKEQRDLLFQKMKEAEYEFDFEKKELKKIEDEEYNGEDYGIDSLYHAQRILEKTLGEVDGYQTDDGILSHKCAITAVKKLYEQKSVWSEEDEKNLLEIKCLIGSYRSGADEYRLDSWIDSFKNRVQPKQKWSEDDEKTLNSILTCIEHCQDEDIEAQYNGNRCVDPNRYEPMSDWLKSIKQRILE